jgi:tetratricopeptide (TPR) repeat protein
MLAAGDAPGAVRQLTLDGRSQDDAAYQELLGQAFLAATDLGVARRALARAVEMDSARFEARFALARLTGREPITAVVAAWAAALDARARRAPDDPQPRVELARVHALAGRSTEAEQALRDALALRPFMPEAHLALARLLLTAGRTDEAIPRLHAVVHSIRRHRQANLLLAEHYEGAGDPGQATTHLQAAYDDQTPVDVTLRLAALYGQARKLDAALALATTAVRDAPGSATAHAVLGRVHRLRGETSAAFRAYETALRLDRELTAAHLALDPAAADADAVRAVLEAD